MTNNDCYTVYFNMGQSSASATCGASCGLGQVYVGSMCTNPESATFTPVVNQQMQLNGVIQGLNASYNVLLSGWLNGDVGSGTFGGTKNVTLWLGAPFNFFINPAYPTSPVFIGPLSGSAWGSSGAVVVGRDHSAGTMGTLWGMTSSDLHTWAQVKLARGDAGAVSSPYVLNTSSSTADVFYSYGSSTSVGQVDHIRFNNGTWTNGENTGLFAE